MSWIAGSVLAVYQGALSTYGAIEKNKSVKRSMNSALYATQIGLNQTDEAAELERRRIANEASLVRSRIRVLTGESGFSGNGSFADLDRAVAIDEQLNLAISKRNQFNQRQLLVSRLDSQLSQFAAEHASPILAGITGSLNGFMSGMSMSGGVQGQTSSGVDAADISPDYGPSDTYPSGYYGGGDFGGSAYT